MDSVEVLPDKPISREGMVSAEFLNLGIASFSDACRYVQQLPYGYNSDRDDILILFAEKMGSCTTKHAVIATLAEELNLPIQKQIGIYAMTDDIVTGTQRILEKYELPYVPMVHCFLTYQKKQVDLTVDNRNGKNRALEEFLYTKTVSPNISAKDEYLLYRKALVDPILKREEMQGIDIKRVLHAREEGLALLRAAIS